jgi:alkanesulfonate monooxygenase SsuD/methylene tetrahydromethanopterin reductase-like flavin-dependent oxidoreductase (luciferase family)
MDGQDWGTLMSTANDRLRLGVVMVPTDPWPETVATARRVEALGYDHLWVYDHLTWRRFQEKPWHAIYPWLTGVAAATERIRIGTMVSSPNIRHPLILAKDAMTIDHISGGRLTIGIGAGGVGFDAHAFGQPTLTPGQRIDRLAEFVDAFDLLLQQDQHHYNGEWYTINEARMLPGCVQRPRVPLAVAASRPRGLTLAARHGQAWITYGDATSEDLSAAGTERIVAAQLAGLEEACAALERDPADIARIFLIGISEARPLTSLEAFVDFVGRYRELGFTDLVFHYPRPEDEVWNDPPEMVEAIAEHLLGVASR